MHWDTRSMPPRLLPGGNAPLRLIAAGVIFALIIIAAVISHVIASRSPIVLGDCVVASPNLATGWGIRKVACTSDPGSGLIIQKVVSVQDDASGQCDLGLTTFQDDPAGKTYCLSGYSFGG